MIDDLLVACRSLKSSRGFTIPALIILALGIGAPGRPGGSDGGFEG